MAFSTQGYGEIFDPDSQDTERPKFQKHVDACARTVDAGALEVPSLTTMIKA
jgi:hypothetical protein